jgi:multidrug efflux pump subunit AcrB
MLSRFFIDRPIFAAVLSIFLVLGGLLSMRALPIAQYPEIAPPVVTVRAIYPGASAETIEQTVAAPLENAINGVENLMYMSSTSASNGALEIQVTFEIGSDVDQAALTVNNRVKQAEPRLPEDVRRQGVTVEKGSSAFLQVFAFLSPDGHFDDLYTSNYVTLNVLDRLKRIPGTTNVQIFGAKDYAMRIWLKPDRMAELGVTADEIAHAIQEQNAQFAAGACRHRKNSATSSCVPVKVPRCSGSRMSRASSWVRGTTTSPASTTASRPPWSASSCSRAQTHWQSATRSRPRSPDWHSSSPRD